MEEKQLDNAVALMGVVASEVTGIDNINTLQYNGWAMYVETVRRNGTADYAVVIMERNTYIEDIEVGTPVMVIGKMQTFKDFATGKVLVYVLADYVERVQGKHWIDQNEVQLKGTIGKGTTYRETPKGKHITDIKVIVPNEVRNSNCFIPCICWQEEATEVKDWEEGTEVVLSGRLQSRDYVKRVNKDTEEQRTCYEVSVNNIKKAEV